MNVAMTRMKRAGWIVAAVVLSTARGVMADPQKFDFKDAKGVNSVAFVLDAPLEAIRGTANGITGEVTFDPGHPGAAKGKIVVATASMEVPNAMMKGHMLGKDWMDADKHPTITFEAESLEDTKTSGDNTTADVKGKLTIKGVTKAVKVPVKFTYLKGKLADRTNGQVQGDLLVMRAKFTIRRADFDINPKAPTDKVSDEVELTLSVAGAAPKA